MIYTIRINEELDTLLHEAAEKLGNTVNFIAEKTAISLRLRPLSYKMILDNVYDVPERIRTLSAPGKIRRSFRLEGGPDEMDPNAFRIRLAEKCVSVENYRPAEPFVPPLREGRDYVIVNAEEA